MKMSRVFTLIRVRTEQNYPATRNHPLQLIHGMTIVADTLTGEESVPGYRRKPVLKRLGPSHERKVMPRTWKKKAKCPQRTIYPGGY
jgi:hypothetical protein